MFSRFINVIISFLCVAVFIGCGSSGSSITPNSPVVADTQKLYLRGGESEIVTVSLKNNNGQSSVVAKTQDGKESYVVSVSANQTQVNFALNNQKLGTVSPSSCLLSSSTPSCDVYISTFDNYDGKVVLTKSDLVASTNNQGYNIVNIETLSASPSRRVYFKNQCDYNVTLGIKNSSVSRVGCSPGANGGSPQANCASGYICYNSQVSGAGAYCVYGTVDANVTKAPPTTSSAITISCSSYNTTTSSINWGVCQCSTNSDCGTGYVCNTADNQCYTNYQVSQINNASNGVLASGWTKAVQTPYFEFPLPSASGETVFSGNFYFKTACDSNGNNCQAGDQVSTGYSSLSPTTAAELTMHNTSVDYYDVSYINGINIPVQISPEYANAVFSSSSSPYTCTVAGGTSSSVATRYTKFAKDQVGVDLNQTLHSNNFDCNYSFGSNLVPFVSDGNLATSCTSSSTCPTNQVCGLTIDNVSPASSNQGQLTCGYLQGYWTYAQLCAKNPTISVSSYNVTCDGTAGSTYGYSQCTNTTAAANAGTSCYNNPNGGTCCGYNQWSFNGNSMPYGMALSSGSVASSTWTSVIMPQVSTVKSACPTAYSYQYDDPFSTFTCQTTPSAASKVASAYNATSYEITLCPSGSKTATGFNPTYVKYPFVAIPACSSTTTAVLNPQSATPTPIPLQYFAVGLGSGLSISSVQDINGTNLSSQNTNFAGYYDLSLSTTSSPIQFYVTVQNASGTSHQCYFEAASTSSSVYMPWNAKHQTDPWCTATLTDGPPHITIPCGASSANWNGRSITFNSF